MGPLRIVLVLVSALSLAACELVADFDADGKDEGRTVRPTPLPTIDAGLPILVDGAARDGALVSDPSDASLRPSDAGASDAAVDASATALDGLDSGNASAPASDSNP